MMRTLPALLCLFAAVPANVAGQAAEESIPVFLAPLRNLTVIQGSDITFTCLVHNLGDYKVRWIRSDLKRVLASNTYVFSRDRRHAVTHNGLNKWQLHINNVQLADSGSYTCLVNTDPTRQQTGHLEVLVPPDIVDEGDSAWLTVEEGNSLRLRCKTTGYPPPIVTWVREDGSDIVLRSPDGHRGLQHVDGETLLLRDVTRKDTGVYLCFVANGVPPSIYKGFVVNVYFRPKIKVSKKMVVVPKGSDVVLECYVEASPRAVSSWHRKSGLGEKPMAHSGSKYVISETLVSDYTWLMNLTVVNLNAADFGSYSCISINEYGHAEGTIQVKEL